MPTINCLAFVPDTQPAQEMMLPFGFQRDWHKAMEPGQCTKLLEILMKNPSKFLSLSQLYLLVPI